MTRIEQIDWLCRLRSGLVWFDVPPKERPMFEEVLSDEINDLQQEPCEDCISRKAVLEPYQTLNDNDTICIWLLRKNIEQQPSVIPQPKTGHWEWVQYGYNSKLGDWHCSECKSVVIECVSKEEKGGIPLYKYCPQCGAKMAESEDKK